MVDYKKLEELVNDLKNLGICVRMTQEDYDHEIVNIDCLIDFKTLINR